MEIMKHKFVDLEQKIQKKISFEEYKSTDKSQIEDFEIAGSDPFDLNDFGGVIVTYKNSLQ